MYTTFTTYCFFCPIQIPQYPNDIYITVNYRMLGLICSDCADLELYTSPIMASSLVLLQMEQTDLEATTY